MRALVTGSSGYIGKILCRILADSGCAVIGVDTKNDPSPDCDYFFNMSYGDFNFLSGTLKVDVIFHLGADSLLGPSVKNPLRYYENNVSNLVKMLTYSGRTPIVFASSAAVYGDLGTNYPLDPSQAGSPINPYGNTKWAGEKVIEDACTAFGLKAYAMRFFNVAGSYQDLGQGLDQPHILTRACMASIMNETFFINGASYPTYDGSCVRDYIHVEDVCRTLIAAANALIIGHDWVDDGFFRAYNVGSGLSGIKSNIELATDIDSKYGLHHLFRGKRDGDPAYLISNSKETHIKFGEPKHTLDSIIESQYEFVKKELRKQ